MVFVYVLSEDDNDDLFFEGCIERMLDRTIKVDSRRLRKGGGVSAAKRVLKFLLRGIKHSGFVEDTFFVVALDNDRCRHHPDHENPLDPGRALRLPKRERDKACRHCELSKAIENELGSQDSWPIKGAIAVPREMLEAWLLLVSNPDLYPSEAGLPLFAEQSKSLAIKYHSPQVPPKQLKNLREIEKERRGIKGNDEFCLTCGTEVDPKQLAQCSPSFAMFKEQVDSWYP